jgi:hypothetical protein
MQHKYDSDVGWYLGKQLHFGSWKMLTQDLCLGDSILSEPALLN